MNPEQQVRQALQSLADHDRTCEARTNAHAIFTRRPTAWRWRAGAALAAAAGLLFVVWPAEETPAPPPAIVSEVKAPVEEPQVTPAAAPKPQAVRRAKRPEPREVVTDFYPLMDAPPPFERGQLLRVVVPASTMRSVGLPINPQRWSERVQADVLVGEEGMARAIRFVSYEE